MKAAAKVIDFERAQRLRALTEILDDDTNPFHLQLVATADLMISVERHMDGAS